MSSATYDQTGIFTKTGTIPLSGINYNLPTGDLPDFGPPTAINITISKSITGEGTVTCPATVPDGTSATCTVTPPTNYRLLSISGCGGSLSGSTYTLGTITAACNISAQFVSIAPTNIEILPVTANGQLTVAWQNPTDPDFAHIHIYRSTVAGQIGTKIADNITGTRYTDPLLSSGITYYYTVKSVDAAGNESTNTAQVSGKTTAISKAVLTICDDFNLGYYSGVQCTADKLSISPDAVNDTPMPYLWVPNTGSGTISKIDITTGKELGRYYTGPAGYDTNPSRTAVDLKGSVWIANRYSGSIVKVGLLEGNTCVDRNGNGTIETSRDLNGDGTISANEMLPWGTDECVLNEVIVIPGKEGSFTPGTYSGGYTTSTTTPGPRSLAVDVQNNIWIGTFGSKKFYKASGSTGNLLKTIDLTPYDHTGYGAITDGLGHIWSAGHQKNHVLKIDTTVEPPVFSTINIGHFAYGIGIDHLNNIYVTGYDSYKLTRFSAANDAVEWTKTKSELYLSRGIAATPDNHTWAVSSNNNKLYRYDTTGNLLATIAVGSNPAGVSIDANGKVWVVDLGDDNIYRIDPATNKVDLIKQIMGAKGHYGYSDMTGSGITTIATTHNRTWTYLYDSNLPGMVWDTITWTETKPLNTDVLVRVRTSQDTAAWSPWTQIASGANLNNLASGQYIMIEVTLAKYLSASQSPTLTNMIIGGSDSTPPSGTIDINNGAASTQVPNVTLILACSDNKRCSAMQFSNDNSTWSAAEPFNGNKAWSLASGDGLKTVYTRFMDASGNWSLTMNDTITLNTTLPLAAASPKGGLYASAQTVTITTNKTATVYYTTNGTDPTTSSSVYSTPLTISSDTTLKFFARDASANQSAISTESYVIDTTGPTGSIVINGGATTTASTAATLTLSATDPHTVTQMKFSTDSITWTSSESYATSKSWTLSSGDGIKTVYVKYQDSLGNWSQAYSTTITLDTPVCAPLNAEVQTPTLPNSLTVSWTNTTGCDYAHIHIYRSTTAGQLGALVGDNITGVALVDNGLASQTTYYYTVKAVDALGNQSTNTTQISGTTLDSTAPAAPSPYAAADTTTGGSITLIWTQPADSDYSHVHIYRSTASGQIGDLVYDNQTGTTRNDTGLTNGATYYYTIRSVDIKGNQSTNVNQVSAVPTAPDSTAPGVVNCSGTISQPTPKTGDTLLHAWAKPGDSDFASLRIYASTASATLGAKAYDGDGTSFTHTGLTANSTYFYTYRSVDSSGNETTNTSQCSFTPLDQVAPECPTALSATRNADNTVTLNWVRSSSADINYYPVYKNGVSTALVQHPTVTWNSAILPAAAYTFKVQAEDKTGNTTSTCGSVSVEIPATPPACPTSVRIKVPHTGKKLGGNRLTVIAETEKGLETDLASILFQYRLSNPANGWTDIPSTDAVKFPNPDISKPWFVHWNISNTGSNLANADYDIRAVATCANTASDAAPPFITVSVDRSQPESYEELDAFGKPVKTENVTPTAAVTVTKADETSSTSGYASVTLPEGSINSATQLSISEPDPSGMSALVPSGTGNPGLFRDISLADGTITLSNGKKATIEIPYRDDNNNGYVDNTGTPGVLVYDMLLCGYDSASGTWTQLDSVVDTANKVVRGTSDSMSRFALLAPPHVMGTGWNMVSVPLTPADPRPYMVYSGTLYAWNPTTSSYYYPGAVEAGQAYFVKGNNNNYTVSGTETGQFAQSIPIKRGWNLVGNPFRYKVNTSDMMITNTTQGITVSLNDAEANGWVFNVFFTFKNGSYEMRSDLIEPWKGYWLLSDVDGYLVVSPVPAQ